MVRPRLARFLPRRRALQDGQVEQARRRRLDAHERRLERQAVRLDELSRRLNVHADRLDRQRNRLDNQSRRLDQFTERVQSWTPFIANARVEFGAISGQLAALEKRVAELEAPPVDGGDANDRQEARSIVEAVRAEHARVRARLTLISAYEERLRRLEIAMREVVRVGGIVPEPMPFELPTAVAEAEAKRLA